MSTEQAYDQLISPLMHQIIAICKEHKIELHATFLAGDENTDAITTHLQNGKGIVMEMLLQSAVDSGEGEQ